MINGNWEIILEAVNIRKALNTAKAVAAVHPHIAPGNTDIVQKISVLISNF
jgi:hypothetical protein